MQPTHKLLRFAEADCMQATLQTAAVRDLPNDPRIQRILILKWGGMGDIVVSTALMEDIRQAFPHAELHLNTQPAWQPLFSHDPRFSRVWTVNLQARAGRWRAYRQWLSEVRAMHYDLIIDLQTNDKSRALLTCVRLCSQAPRHLLGNHPVFPYTLRQTQSFPNAHSFQIMQQTLLTAGIPLRTSQPKLYVDASTRASAEALLAKHGLLTKPFVVLLCGSHAQGLTKRWSSSHYATLAQYYLQQGLSVVLLGGADDAETCAEIAAANAAGLATSLSVESTLSPALSATLVNMCGQTRLLEVPIICAQAQTIVANDTGTAHLASATNTPMTVICGPTQPLRVKPLGQQVQALQLDVPCKNCYAKQCSHHSCMQQLTPDRLLAHLPDLKAHINPGVGHA